MFEKQEFPTHDDMRKDLQGWGVGLIVIGIISIVLRSFLDPIWGGLLIIVGILALFIHHRGMFIFLGMMLILAGLINMLGGGGWMIFGVLQIVIGIQEIAKYGKYANVDTY